MITNSINSKIYFGKTNNPIRRWIMHRYLAKAQKLQYPIYRAITKYGVDNFTFNVIEEHLTESDVLAAEIWFIEYFKSIGATLYNLTNGGEGITGRHHSLDTRRKIAIANTGKKRPRLTNTDDHKRKVSKALRGRVYSKERKIKWLQKINKTRKRKIDFSQLKLSEKGIIKSKLFSGENGPNAKLTEEKVRQIKQLLLEGFSCVSIAAKFNVSKSAIADISRGRCWKHITIDQ